MKTNELTGDALDWAVAKCEGENSVASCYYDDDTPLYLDEAHEPTWNPTTDWAQGGPIIEREKITWDGMAARIFVPERNCSICVYGPTTLIAAMRCYVASKLGDDVEIPEQLREKK